MWALVNVGPCKNLPISISSLSLMKLHQKTKRRYILECIMSRSLIQCQKNLSKRPASLEMKTNWTLENNNMERWRLSIKVVQLWNHDDSSRSCWCCVHFIFQLLSFIFLKILFIYFQREGKGKRKRGRETSMCGCLSHTPYWGPGPQYRHVPSLGMEPATLWFAGQHSIHWATPARVRSYHFCVESIISKDQLPCSLPKDFLWALEACSDLVCTQLEEPENQHFQI